MIFKNSSLWQKILDKMLNKLLIGSIEVTYPDGLIKTYKGEYKGPNTSVTFCTQKSIKDSLLGGSLGFCEAVISGEIKSKSMHKLFEILGNNNSGLNTYGYGYFFMKILNKVSHHLNKNTKVQAKKNISFHYDLGNEFYKLWLDKSMTYSCAIFENQNISLEKAQILKYQKLADIIKLKKNESLLEVGCGWGGFTEFAAKKYSSLVTAITISKKQFQFAKKRIDNAGLGEKVNFNFKDYREINGQFDKIISIEMFEAVGENYWPIYFKQIKNLLSPKGVAGIQVITINDEYFNDYKRFPDFIQKYIFPGGMLPSLKAIEQPIKKSGLKIEKINSFGIDYANTLSIWRKRFNKSWPNIEKLGFDENFKRMWNLYFSYCEGGFRSGGIDVKQIKIISNN